LTEGAENRRATISEVAHLAGVSPATVSNVFSGKGRVHPVLRERVLAVGRELGYQPHPLAQALRTGRNRTIGFAVAFISNPTVPAILQSASRAAHEAGYNLLICVTEYEPALERAQLEGLARQRVAAVISFHPGDDPEPYLLAQRAGVQLLLVDHRPEGVVCDFATSDHQATMRAAVEHLLASGRRRIALLLNTITINQRRVAGYEDAYRAAGLTAPPGLVVTGLYTEEATYAAMDALFSRPDPPDAVIAGVGLLVQWVLARLRARGLSIPQQVAFVGAGDLRWGRLIEPPLSMIEIDGQEHGRTLVELAIERLEHGQSLPPVREVRLDSRFVARESSDPSGVVPAPARLALGVDRRGIDR
jgi:DNA-binding LacI/PurR family transcriptional regulator